MSVSIVGGTVQASAALAIDAKTGTTYTFVLTDANNELITASNASAQTYSIPTNASVAFPIGCQINIIQIGAGQVTIKQLLAVQHQFFLLEQLLLHLNLEHSILLQHWSR
jgi:hypothetical protein